MSLFESRRAVLALLTGASLFCGNAGIAQPVPSPQNIKIQSDGKEEEHVYEPGGDVAPPKLLHYVEPEFSPDSREAYVEGTVKISTIVTSDGKTREWHVVNGLSAEEDRRAIEALKRWTFKPGTKSGKPVNVRMTVQIDFHLL